MTQLFVPQKIARTILGRQLRVNRLDVILAENNLAVNNRRTRRLVDRWCAASPDPGIFRHEFPTDENIPHDFIDRFQPDARTDKMNALLTKWLTGHAGLEERLHPSFSCAPVAD